MASHATSRLARHLLDVRVAKVADLEALGFSSAMLSRHRRSGLLEDVETGVVGLAVDPDPWRQRLAAAFLVRPEAVASHQTAAQLHGIGFVSPEIHLTVEHGRWTGGRHVAIHQHSLPSHHVTTVDGVTTTTASRTLCDLAALATDDKHFRILVRAALDARIAERSRLIATSEEMAGRGRPGAGRRRRVLGPLLAGEASKTRSPLERALQAITTDAGIEGIEWQYRPPWFDGVRGVVDAAIPSAQLIIEADGRAFHETQAAFATDRARDRLAAEHGWRVLRFTYDDVTHHPERVVASIRAALSTSDGTTR